MSHEFGIIGAGIHGLTAAYHLAQRGHSVVVFDKGDVAGGPTGQASGVIRSYYTHPFLARVAHASTQILADFDARVGGTSGFQRTGALYVHGAKDIRQVRATSAALSTAGIANAVVGPDELAEHFPAVDLKGVAIGVWEELAGYASPYDTAVSYARRAADLGVQLELGHRVVRIVERAQGVRVSLDDDTRFDVDRLLVAAGPWTAPLLRQVGAIVPLTAERHVVAGLRHPFDAAPGDVLSHVLIDIVSGYYARPWEGDGFLLGPLAPTTASDPDELDPAITTKEFAWLARRAAARVPSRGTATRAAGWASLYDVSPDWQPVIGRVSEHVFVDAGTSGHGFKLAPVLGDYVARMLLGDLDDELVPFSPERFDWGGSLDSGFGAARILG